MPPPSESATAMSLIVSGEISASESSQPESPGVRSVADVRTWPPPPRPLPLLFPLLPPPPRLPLPPPPPPMPLPPPAAVLPKGEGGRSGEATGLLSTREARKEGASGAGRHAGRAAAGRAGPRLGRGIGRGHSGMRARRLLRAASAFPGCFLPRRPNLLPHSRPAAGNPPAAHSK